MPRLKHLLWRLAYAVVLIVVLLIITPLLLSLLGLSLTAVPVAAITLLKFAFGVLVLIYIFFGPEPYAWF
jgi:hypothetical protein